jgi:predicted branched-subunit amino acid permease
MAFSRRVAGVVAQRRGIIAMPPRAHFIRGILRNASIAAGLIGGGLAIGMTGYHSLGEMSWLEAFYYSSMILAGEGPPADPANLTGLALAHLHLFAGFYALFSGVTFITLVGVLFAPALHRFLHRFHLEIAAPDDEAESS